MGWVKVTDDFYDNDKFSLVGPLGVALHMAATAFCNRNLTDGYIKKNKARMLMDFDGISVTTVTGEMFAGGVDGEDAAKLVLEWMVAADLLHETGHDCDDCHGRDDGGEPGCRDYLVHDYLEFQPSRAEVEAKAEANRERVRKFKEARYKGGNGVTNALANALTNAGVTEQLHDTPTPTPTPSSSLIPKEGIKEEGLSRSEVSHQGATTEPPLKCPTHRNHTDVPKCYKCQKAREANEAWHEAKKADELDARRRLKELRENCALCKGTNTIEVDDGSVRKCDHGDQQQGTGA